MNGQKTDTIHHHPKKDKMTYVAGEFILYLNTIWILASLQLLHGVDAIRCSHKMSYGYEHRLE